MQHYHASQRILLEFIAFFLALTTVFCAGAEELQPARLAYSHRLKKAFYPVQGANTGELISSMRQRGPIGHGNKRFFAYTLWQIKLVEGKGVKCRISILMPHLWKDRNHNLEIRVEWERFLRALVAHESEHVSMAMRSCRSLQSHDMNEAKLKSVSKRLKKRDLNFDRSNQHGILDGVILAKLS